MTPEQLLFLVRFTIAQLVEYGLCNESEGLAATLRLYECGGCTEVTLQWDLELAWAAGLAFEAPYAAPRLELWQ